MTRQNTYIDYLEEVVDDVAQWAADYVEEICRALAPDGRAFGQAKLSEREELGRYMQELRGNSEAWAEWIRDRVNKIKESLAKSNLSEDLILQAHPYDIVEAMAISYSNRMERLYKEYQAKALAERATLRPLSPQTPLGMTTNDLPGTIEPANP